MPDFARHKDYAPYDLRDYQLRVVDEAKEALQEAPSLLTTAPTGAGKCCSPETPLLLHNGRATTHGQVRPGYQLMGSDGKPRNVINTTAGYGPMFEVKPDDGGAVWQCNDAHILTLAPCGNATAPLTSAIDVPLNQYLRWPAAQQARYNLLRLPFNFHRGQTPTTLHSKAEKTGFTVTPVGNGPYCGFSLDGDGRYLLEDCTVTHNTVIFSDICEKIQLQNRTAVVMVHRQELVKQAVKTLRRQAGIDPGVVWKRRQEFNENITVVAHGALTADGAEWRGPRPHLLIIDEAHHTKAEGWMKAIRKLNPRYLLGFTATPFRFDRNPLTPEPFAQVRRSITPKELIDKGVLVPPVIVTPVITDAAGNPVPINRAANPAETYLRAVRYGLAQSRRKFIVYVSSSGRTRPRENAQRTVNLISKELGLPVDAIDDSMSEKNRDTAVARYQNANEAVLVNYATLTEGVDIPETDCLVIGRATRSESSIIQMLGRGIRSFPGKADCLVIDYTGRNDLHHMVDYYRTDEEAREAKQREKRERSESEPAELLQISSAFPAMVSQLLGWRLRLPWFHPWPEEPLTALCLWHPDRQKSAEYRYIYVRHAADGTIVGGKVRIRHKARPPYRLSARRGMDDDSAAGWIRQELSPNGLANRLSRNAPWRTRASTEGQKQSWEAATGHEASERSTFGEISDLLAKIKFIESVPVNATK